MGQTWAQRKATHPQSPRHRHAPSHPPSSCLLTFWGFSSPFQKAAGDDINKKISKHISIIYWARLRGQALCKCASLTESL